MARISATTNQQFRPAPRKVARPRPDRQAASVRPLLLQALHPGPGPQPPRRPVATGPVRRAVRQPLASPLAPILTAQHRAARDVKRAVARTPNPPRPTPGLTAAARRDVIRRVATTLPAGTVGSTRFFRAQREAQNAAHGRPFNLPLAREAVGKGWDASKTLTVSDGRVFRLVRRHLLPDYRDLLNPKTGQPKAGLNDKERLSLDRAQAGVGVQAAGQKVLQTTTIPVHGLAGAVESAVTGRPLSKTVKDATFGRVLRDVGAPKAVQFIGGTAADIALDPLTYAGGGVGSVAERAAAKAGARAAGKAAKAGLSDVQQEAFRARAAAQAARKAPAGRGLVVRFAGREVPGVRSATARLAPAVGKVTGSRAGQTVRGVLGDVNPNLAPKGIDPAGYAAARRAARTARAGAQRGEFQAQQQAVALHKAIGKDNYRQVIDAIEADKLGGLPAHLRDPAKRLRDQFRYSLRVQRQAGVHGTHALVVRPRSDAAKGYFPHVLSDTFTEGAAGGGVTGARRVRVASSKGREYPQALATLRVSHPGLFREDLPLVAANRRAQATTSAARGRLNQRLAALGRPARPGMTLGEHEKIFHLHGADLTPVDRIPARPSAGRYVVLDSRLVDTASQRFTAQPSGPGIFQVYDRAQAGFKRVATFTPGFHIRNLVGDTGNAYLGQPAARLAANLVRSGRAVKVLSGREAQMRKTLAVPQAGAAGVKINGRHVTFDALTREAEAVGAVRQGFIGREIPELAGQTTGVVTSTGTAARKGVGKVTQALRNEARQIGVPVNRWMQNREDVARLATYIAARKRGLDPEHAAEYVALLHFDYGDITQFERTVARRVMPFYTFSARNIPLQSRMLLTQPGKIANFQKIREEAAQAQGLPPGYEKRRESQYEQRNLGIPTPWGDVSMSLPLTDLNEFPGAAGKAQAGEYLQKAAGLVTPLIKDPVELFANYSFYFRDRLQSPDAPLVPAPAWTRRLPPAAKAATGWVSDYVDKRTGKRGPAWNGKADYLAKVVPGLPNLVQNLQTTGNRRGQSTGQKIAGIAGVKVAPLDEQAIMSARLQALYQQRDELTTTRNALAQRAATGGNAAAKSRANERIRAVNAEIYRIKRERGDKVLPRRRAAPAAGGVNVGGVVLSPQDLQALAGGAAAPVLSAQDLRALAGP